MLLLILILLIDVTFSTPTPDYVNYALATGKPDYHAIHIGPPKCLIWYAMETCSAHVGSDPSLRGSMSVNAWSKQDRLEMDCGVE